MKQHLSLFARCDRRTGTTNGQDAVVTGGVVQTRYSARSASLIGLQAVSAPLPKTRNGLPFRKRSNWPDIDLK
jgi:hypothetical protein